MYALNENGFVVDTVGRVLVGLDGNGIRINSPPARVAGRKPGPAKGSVVRAKAPAQLSMDLPLCTVQNGVTPGTKWYVGEMLNTRSGTATMAKRWKLFEESDLTSVQTDKELSQLAWKLVQECRASAALSVGVLGGLKTPQQDAAALRDMAILPSKLAIKERDAKTRAKRVAAGKRMDGRARGHDNRKNITRAVKKSM